MDGVEDLPLIAQPEVGATDAAAEEGVPGEQEVLGGEVQADAAGGVAWCVQNVDRMGTELEGSTVFGTQVRRQDGGFGDAEKGCLLRHERDKRKIELMVEDGSAGAFAECPCGCDVVDVGVGDDDVGDAEPVLGEDLFDTAEVSTGIDDEGV